MVVALTVGLTVVGAIVALPYVNQVMAGAPAVTVAPSRAPTSASARATPASSPTSTPVPRVAFTAEPSTADPGVAAEAFAAPGAAKALMTAEAGADADLRRLKRLDGVTLVGHQRTLRCVADPLKPGMLICTVYAYAYVAWDGGFTDGHDEVVDALTDPCSFAETSHIDWTPPAETARQQQGGCPGRPNMWVHWSTGLFTTGVLDCQDAWYNDCAPGPWEIITTLPDFAWMGRVRSGYAFPLPDTAGSAGASPEATAGVTAPQGQQLDETDAVFGDQTAVERTRAVLRANLDTEALTKIDGVTLAGTRESLGCAEGQTNAVRKDSSVRLTCQVMTVQYLAWRGEFAPGRKAVLKALTRVCPWRKNDTFGWKPGNAHIMSQERAECPGESPAMWVDWAHADHPDLVYPCYYDAYRECTPDVALTANRLGKHVWAARVSIRYEFYKERA